MAGKFVELSDAAKQIGVTPEALVEMRSKGEIFGYRDGASWKFKQEEVARVISERGSPSGTGSAIMSANEEEFDSLLSGLSSKVNKGPGDSGSLLVSEEELGVSSKGPSTIIGKAKKGEVPTPAADSDIKLADDDHISTGSDKLLEAPGSKLNLAADPADAISGSGLKKTGSGTGAMPKVPAKSGSTGDGLDLGDELSLHADDDLELGSDDALDNEISLDSPGPGGTRGGSSHGSGLGSDVTLGAGDSGINLAPTDSGLSLEEEPLDLGGSQVESLELPEDDEVISLESESADPDQATQLKADNDFMLSPGDSLGEDESDSGSQVIALEDSEGFDQEAATMLKSEPGGPLAADAFQPMEGGEMTMVGGVGGMGGGGMGATQPVYVQIPVVEAPYSVWNVLSLMLISVALALTGMMMVDVMLNMWAFNGTTSVSTGLMDTFIKTFGLDG